MGITVKIKLVAVIVFVLVGLGATAYAMGAFASGGTSAAQYLTAAVTRGTVTQAAAATPWPPRPATASPSACRLG